MKHCSHVCVAHLCFINSFIISVVLLIFHFSSVSRARGGVGWHKRRVSGRLGFWASSQNQSNHRQRDHKYKSYQSIQSLLYTNPRKSPSIAVRQCWVVRWGAIINLSDLIRHHPTTAVLLHFTQPDSLSNLLLIIAFQINALLKLLPRKKIPSEMNVAPPFELPNLYVKVSRKLNKGVPNAKKNSENITCF